MKTHQIKLKSCPGCGSNKVIIDIFPESVPVYFGFCKSCSYSSPIFYHLMKLKKWWNKKSKRKSILFRKF